MFNTDVQDYETANRKIKKLLTPAEVEVAKGIADVIAQTADMVADDYQIWGGADALRDFAKKIRKMNDKTFCR
jgi:hypothetical protein